MTIRAILSNLGFAMITRNREIISLGERTYLKIPIRNPEEVPPERLKKIDNRIAQKNWEGLL
ncbi:hypothetical protein [Halorubrum gandharaense]